MGMGGTVLAGLTAPADRRRSGDSPAPFLVAAGLIAVALAVFGSRSRATRRGAGRSRCPACSPRSRCSARSGRAWALVLFYFLAFGGFVAMYLYLPKLLTGVHDLSKTDAGARAAGLRAARRDRPPARRLARRTASAPSACCSSRSPPSPCSRSCLAVGYESMVPLTICCLAMALALGLGTGAVFKLVPVWFPDRVGAVTGVVGAAGGLGGFFPPLVMGVVKSATGGYALGFVLMAAVALGCLVVLRALRGPEPAPAPA